MSGNNGSLLDEFLSKLRPGNKEQVLTDRQEDVEKTREACKKFALEIAQDSDFSRFFNFYPKVSYLDSFIDSYKDVIDGKLDETLWISVAVYCAVEDLLDDQGKLQPWFRKFYGQEVYDSLSKKDNKLGQTLIGSYLHTIVYHRVMIRFEHEIGKGYDSSKNLQQSDIDSIPILLLGRKVDAIRKSIKQMNTDKLNEYAQNAITTLKKSLEDKKNSQQLNGKSSAINRQLYEIASFDLAAAVTENSEIPHELKKICKYIIAMTQQAIQQDSEFNYSSNAAKLTEALESVRSDSDFIEKKTILTKIYNQLPKSKCEEFFKNFSEQKKHDLIENLKGKTEEESKETGTITRLFNDFPTPPYYDPLVEAFPTDPAATQENFDDWRDLVLSYATKDLFTVHGELLPWVYEIFGHDFITNALKNGSLPALIHRDILNSFYSQIVVTAVSEKLGKMHSSGVIDDNKMIHLAAMCTKLSDTILFEAAQESNGQDSKPKKITKPISDLIDKLKNKEEQTTLTLARCEHELIAAIENAPLPQPGNLGNNVLEAVTQVKTEPNPSCPPELLSQVLTESAHLISNLHKTSNHNNMLELIKTLRIYDKTKILCGTLLVLLGVAVIAASVLVAVATLGGGTPLAGIGITAGMAILGVSGTTLAGAAIGTGAVAGLGAGVIGGSMVVNSLKGYGLFRAAEQLHKQATDQPVNKQATDQPENAF